MTGKSLKSEWKIDVHACNQISVRNDRCKQSDGFRAAREYWVDNGIDYFISHYLLPAQEWFDSVDEMNTTDKWNVHIAWCNLLHVSITWKVWTACSFHDDREICNSCSGLLWKSTNRILIPSPCPGLSFSHELCHALNNLLFITA